MEECYLDFYDKQESVMERGRAFAFPLVCKAEALLTDYIFPSKVKAQKFLFEFEGLDLSLLL